MHPPPGHFFALNASCGCQQPKDKVQDLQLGFQLIPNIFSLISYHHLSTHPPFSLSKWNAMPFYVTLSLNILFSFVGKLELSCNYSLEWHLLCKVRHSLIYVSITLLLYYSSFHIYFNGPFICLVRLWDPKGQKTCFFYAQCSFFFHFWFPLDPWIVLEVYCSISKYLGIYKAILCY